MAQIYTVFPDVVIGYEEHLQNELFFCGVRRKT